MGDMLVLLGDRILGFETASDPEESSEEAQLGDIAAQVEQARRDWQAAKAYFENVSDPELVDHAIHLVLATEKRYAYLLKQAKKTYARVYEA
jgi:hypothetical protein